MKYANQMVYLHEEVLLIALQDQKGSVDWRAGQFLSVIAGGILAELLLAKKISFQKDEKKLINTINDSKLGDPVLDLTYQIIKNAKRRKNLNGWVGKLTDIPKLKEIVAKELCKKGILKEEESKVLWLFRVKRYPELNPKPERQLLKRIENAIFSEREKVDLRTTLLISLTYSSNLLAIPFSNKELKQNKKRIKQIINGELVGKATGEVIQAIQTAAMIVAIIPAITVSTTVNM